MGWRHLLFENWPNNTAELTSCLPSELTPDEFKGSAWLSITPFTNVSVRPKGVPKQLKIRVPELNVRTYVTHDGIPSVYFFSLDAQSFASVLGARLFHHLPYYYARILLALCHGRVAFESRRLHAGSRPASYKGIYWPVGEPFYAPSDPQATFLVERYRLNTEGQNGTIRYTNIEHEPWTLYPATNTVETNTMFAALGFKSPSGTPVRYYSPGVDVETSRSRVLKGN